MSALDTLNNIDGLDIHTLDPVQRILLITDGTLTEILEAAFLERILLVKISQQFVTGVDANALLEPHPRENFLERKILLRGETSKKNYAYAQSYIACERLSLSFREQLLNSSMPLGRLWLEQRLETFKELHEVRCQPAEELGNYFGCAETTPTLVRSYCVFSATRPIMLITEHLPVL